MKKHLFSKKVAGLILTAILLTSNLFCQTELIQGGSMETSDEDSWTVNIIGRMETDPTGDQIPEYEFGSSESCAAGEGNSLRVWAAGTGYVNIIFSQEVVLKANTVYKANAAFKDLTDGTLDNFWTQLKIGLEAAPEHENDGIKLAGTNTWSGCGNFGDDWIQNIACDWEAGLENGAGYLTPDTLGETFTAHFAIVVGMWTNEESGAFPYNIALDEVTLVDSVGGTSALRSNALSGTNLSIYPNPVNSTSNIKYTLENSGNLEITIINTLGQEVANPFKGYQSAGTYTTSFDATNLPDGLYISRMQLDNKLIQSKTLIINKD